MKEILFDFASRLDRTENLYIFAGQLSRYVNVEITALTYRSPKELVDLSRYLISLAENRRMADMGLSKY
ncbi:hypothetical protein D3X11_01345 [Streptococcus sp. X16XC17]|nr:hypothetical protein D3X11_01345 [Streptococcus sp. X16XC17]